MCMSGQWWWRGTRLAIMSSVEMIHPTCCSNEWMRVLKLAKSHNKPNPGTNEMT